MNLVTRRDGRLYFEDVALDAIAHAHGTPTYVYSRAALESTFHEYDQAFAGHEHLICYAVKANSSLAILNLFARLGAGFDIVSGGELARVLAAGGDPGKIVFSGVGKTAEEMRAALTAGIHCFNVESESELHHLSRVAGELGKTAPVSLRVNPNVDAKTHPYISTGLKENKFGIAHDEALRVYRLAASLPNLQLVGIDCHIGSQLTETAPFAEALDKVLQLVDALAADGIVLRHLDMGGGVGIRYRDETPPVVGDYARTLLRKLSGRPQKLILEPGRSLVGNAGLLLTRVEYLKHGEAKDFAIVDAAMNDLMRPALYDAWHDIVPVSSRAGDPRRYEIVGPVCESGDFLGHDRELVIAEGDLLAILSAGAYGMSMSSNYNTRARAAEVMVDGDRAHLIRRREDIAALFANEVLLS
ncbi:MAG: diaminopimelate decarboxylase [Hydrogenophilaceae bacterium]|nr:diaminopimelate decarboxylase [Hydrogenophilaceae bacterium]